jgi:hypothetical protein
MKKVKQVIPLDNDDEAEQQYVNASDDDFYYDIVNVHIFCV